MKSDKTLVVVRCTGEECHTGLKNFGAMLGDNVEVGCNSVLNPGTVIGRGELFDGAYLDAAADLIETLPAGDA